MLVLGVADAHSTSWWAISSSGHITHPPLVSCTSSRQARLAMERMQAISITGVIKNICVALEGVLSVQHPTLSRMAVSFPWHGVTTQA
eukprot:366176-Chlamydomonas_euryale.AAC.2